MKVLIIVIVLMLLVGGSYIYLSADKPDYKTKDPSRWNVNDLMQEAEDNQGMTYTEVSPNKFVGVKNG